MWHCFEAMPGLDSELGQIEVQVIHASDRVVCHLASFWDWHGTLFHCGIGAFVPILSIVAVTLVLTP